MSVLPQRARRSFVADPSSVAQARRFARVQLDEWGAPELQDSAALAVSELVTNAVVHTGTTAVVDLRLDSNSLRVEVEDQHPGRSLPTGLRAPDDESEGGRGLIITSSIASSWGVEYTPTTKRVWLVCDRNRPAAHDGVHGRMPHSVTVEGAAVAVVELAADGAVVGLERRRHPSLRLAAGAGRGPALPPDRRPGRRTASARGGGSAERRLAGRLLAARRRRLPGPGLRLAPGGRGRHGRPAAGPGSPADADRAPGRPHRHPRRIAGSRTRSGCATTRCCGSPSTTTCRWRRSGSGTRSTPTRRTS